MILDDWIFCILILFTLFIFILCIFLVFTIRKKNILIKNDDIRFNKVISTLTNVTNLNIKLNDQIKHTLELLLK